MRVLGCFLARPSTKSEMTWPLVEPNPVTLHSHERTRRVFRPGSRIEIGNLVFRLVNKRQVSVATSNISITLAASVLDRLVLHELAVTLKFLAHPTDPPRCAVGKPALDEVEKSAG